MNCSKSDDDIGTDWPGCKDGVWHQDLNAFACRSTWTKTILELPICMFSVFPSKNLAIKSPSEKLLSGISLV